MVVNRLAGAEEGVFPRLALLLDQLGMRLHHGDKGGGVARGRLVGHHDLGGGLEQIGGAVLQLRCFVDQDRGEDFDIRRRVVVAGLGRRGPVDRVHGAYAPAARRRSTKFTRSRTRKCDLISSSSTAMPNSSSHAIVNSMPSRLSAPRSSTSIASSVTLAASTPR